MSLTIRELPNVNSELVTQCCEGKFLYCSLDSNCTLSKKPLYCLSFFQLQVKNSNWYVFNERRVDRTLDILSWNDDDLVKLMLGIRNHCFQKTVRSCKVNDLHGYETVDGDQYEVHWDEENHIALTSLQGASISLSLKLAIVSDDQGIASGLVTIHPSGSH